MNNLDSHLHAQGRSQFINDMVEPEGMLFGAVLFSPVAHGEIVRLDTRQALSLHGVYDIITAEMIPGENLTGAITADQPLLAEREIHYIGQPIALVIGDNPSVIREAAERIELEITHLPWILNSRKAHSMGHILAPSRTFALGNVETAWKNCQVIVDGQVDSGGQEHIYLETQVSLAFPTESGGVKVYSATQAPTAVQREIATVLGLAMHVIEVEVPRLGGAFGGKEEQATPWAIMAALAALRLKRPVKMLLNHKEDMLLTGKRHPYSSNFKLGLTSDGLIWAYEVEFFQNGGAFTDLSPAIIGRSLFHCTNSYFIPHVKATGHCCRTNLAPNTALRGFGAPQAMVVIEAAIIKAANKLGIDASLIQEKNLLNKEDKFPYGMRVKNNQARNCWQGAVQRYQVESRRRQIQLFNEKHLLEKKGLALMPICFGISFTNTMLNQASALVHIYTDGSVSVSTGAVEMGQGIKTKLRQVVAQAFSIDPGRIRLENTNTSRIANMSPTAASSGLDLNGNAASLACKEILTRLHQVAADELQVSQEDLSIHNETVCLAAKSTKINWEKLIELAYLSRTNLSAQAYYATPDISFDRQKEKGEPFAYHVFGTAVTEISLDCLRGTYTIDQVEVVHDFGQSINPVIDRGQIEGGVVQGIGWVTIEELLYDEQGALLTDSLATYKIPDIHFSPREIKVHFLDTPYTEAGCRGAKALGEPPFMYGIGSYLALLQAMKAFRPDLKQVINPPLTPERVLLALYEDHSSQ